MQCAKCKSSQIACYRTDGEDSYAFCESCMNILDSFGQKTNIMHIFLRPEEENSEITKNILKARAWRSIAQLPHNRVQNPIG